jgi:hypothetical protein
MKRLRVARRLVHGTGPSRHSWVLGAILLVMAGLPVAASAEAVADFPVPDDPFVGPALVAPRLIVAGPDGNLWFLGGVATQIGRITPNG